MKARDLVLGRYLFSYCIKTKEFQRNRKIVQRNLLLFFGKFNIFSLNRNVKKRLFCNFSGYFCIFFFYEIPHRFLLAKFIFVNKCEISRKSLQNTKENLREIQHFSQKFSLSETLNKTPCKNVAYYCIYTLCILY